MSKIFIQVNAGIENDPDTVFKGKYNREDMDEDDLKELGSWEEDDEWEGGWIKTINGKEYQIIIESKNTRPD